MGVFVLAVSSCVYLFMVCGMQLGFVMQSKVLNLPSNGAINRHDLVSASFFMRNKVFIFQYNPSPSRLILNWTLQVIITVLCLQVMFCAKPPTFYLHNPTLHSANYLHCQSHVDWYSILCADDTHKTLIAVISISQVPWLHLVQRCEVMGDGEICRKLAENDSDTKNKLNR